MDSLTCQALLLARSRLQFWFGGAAHGGTETFLELVDATFGVDKLLLTGEERMRVRCDTYGDHAVLHAIDDFFTVRCLGRGSHNAGTRGHVDENHRLVFGMNGRFHKIANSTRFQRAGRES